MIIPEGQFYFTGELEILSYIVFPICFLNEDVKIFKIKSYCTINA